MACPAPGTRVAAWTFAAALGVLPPDGREVPDVRACRTIVLVAPRDGWRLTIEANGSARINYAALPQTARAGTGTFVFTEVHSKLAASVRPDLDSGCAGIVEFVGSGGRSAGGVWCLGDENLAVDQFDWGWSHLDRGTADIESEDVEILRLMWVKRTRPRRGR